MAEASVQELSGFLNQVSLKNDIPSDLSFIYYILVTECSISLKDMQDIPIPYLLSLIDTHQYLKKEEEKAHKKASKR